MSQSVGQTEAKSKVEGVRNVVFKERVCANDHGHGGYGALGFSPLSPLLHLCQFYFTWKERQGVHMTQDFTCTVNSPWTLVIRQYTLRGWHK